MKVTATYYLGVDIGTTSLSLAVVDADTYSVTTTETVRWQLGLEPDVSGAYLQNAERIVAQVLSYIDSYAKRFGIFAGIGVTGQMHGIVYTASGKAKSPLYTWLDKRGAHLADGAVSYQQALFETTGERVPLGYGALTHFALAHSGRLPEGANAFCTIADYVVMRLCGLLHPVTDVTLAQSIGLFDPTTLRFAEQPWARLGHAEFLPEVRQAGAVIGRYKGSAVVTPVGDNQASFVGAVKEFATSALVTLGTSGQVSWLNAGYGPHVSSGVEARPFPEGSTLLVGASLTGGKAFQLLADFVDNTVFKVTGQRLQNPYELLDLGTEQVSLPYLHVDTRFAGSRSGVAKSGAISSITLDNFDLEHLVHGFAQGVVNELHAFWAEKSSGERSTGIDRLVGSGNLLRSNRLVKQLLQATFTLPLMMTTYLEEAAVGAAINAIAVTQGQPLQAVAGKVVNHVVF